MHGWLVELSALRLVTGVADVRLLTRHQNRIVRSVNLVAARAGDVVAAVRTGLPRDASLVVMMAVAVLNFASTLPIFRPEMISQNGE